MLWTILLFSLALSLDGFGVGLSYGLQKIRIPVVSFVVICISSAVAVTVSMLAGNALASLLAPEWANLVGALVLITVGGWILLQNVILHLVPECRTFEFKLPNLGLVVNILKEPAQADFDRSGVIDFKEAVFLGFALAMDALAAGFGAAMAGFSPLWTPLIVAVSKFVLVSLGLYIGRRCVVDRVKGEMALIPGSIIMLLGLTKLIRL